MKLWTGIATAALAVLIAASPPVRAEDTPEMQAQQAALNWLALLDAGDYQQSWVTAADYFQSSIEERQWASTVSQVRRPLRAVKSRTVSSVTFVNSTAPGGDHFVIQFSTDFRRKSGATETVTLLKNLDGRWRVSGYHIR
ncbi:MAG TPA: DUF4019 domain-containing protein [Steroidobacteraceae bacterium]|jgi:hypothetical protein|nr:DUF4019 domain-containing protein [Steroidobacteraceae bacterium]